MTTAEKSPLSGLTADGVFESMRTYGRGKVFRLADHLERLSASAKTIGLEMPYPPEVLAAEIERALAADGRKEAYVRLSLVRASGAGGDPSREKRRLRIIVTGVKKYPAEFYRQGVKIGTAAARKPAAEAQPGQAKSLNFLPGVLARAETGEWFETLVFNPRGELTEGTVSNVFAVKNSQLVTPPIYLGILPGVTRKVALELAAEAGMETGEAVLTRCDLYNADEVFLTNTTMEIMPVREVDGRRIGNGRPGKFTRRLLKAFREKVKREDS